MTVKRILQRKGATVVTSRPDKPIAALAQLFKSQHIGAVVVVGEDGAILGMASERDIVNHFAERGETGLARGVVADIMSISVVTCGPNDRLDKVMEQMTRYCVRHLPVVEDGRLVGIVSIGDAIMHRLEENKLEIDVLRDAARARPVG